MKVIVEDAVLRTLFKFPSCKDPHETDVLATYYTFLEDQGALF